MNFKNIKMFLWAVCCMIYVSADAQIQLPAVFTDGMVLQQKSKVALWGWGSPADRLDIVPGWAEGDTVRVTVDSQGRWKPNCIQPQPEALMQ